MERENIEWNQCYYFDTGKTDLPRILLIGDSIVAQYREKVSGLLRGLCTITAFSTSKIAGDHAIYKELHNALCDYPVDAVYFNNGLHGLDYSADFYRRGLLDMIDFLQENCRGRLYWRSSTPITVCRHPEQLDPLKNAIVLERNRIAAEIMKDRQIPVDDLYQVVLGHPEYSQGDGFHYNPAGVDVMAEHVADFLKKRVLDR